MLTKGQEHRRGWPVLLASAIGSGVGVATLLGYSLGALVDPLVHAFGWSRAEVTAAPIFKSIGMIAAGAGVGALADRYGARKVAIISQISVGVALMCMCFMTPQIWTLYAGFFLLCILGAGTLPMVWSRAITGWFINARGLALGLSLMGTGIAGALLPTYISTLVTHFGWRGAFLGLAALPLCVGLPLSLLWFREPEDSRRTVADPAANAANAAKTAPAATAINDGLTFRSAMGTLAMWQMCLSFFLTAMVVASVLAHALPLLTDRGVPRGTAAALSGLFGLAVVSGRLISGYFLDLFRGARLVGVVIFAMPALGCTLLLFAGDNLFLCGLSILLAGLAAGAESDIAGYLTAKYFGRRNYGAIYGLVYTLYSLGGGLGSFMAGLVYDRTGHYDTALYGGIALLVVAVLLIGTLRPPAAPAPVAVS